MPASNGAIGRLALAHARLAALTGDKLHRAKAEALAGAIMVSQNPVTGQIHDNNLDAPRPGLKTGGGWTQVRPKFIMSRVLVTIKGKSNEKYVHICDGSNAFSRRRVRCRCG